MVYTSFWLRSFWGYLVYFVPFEGFIGVSLVYFVRFGASSGILGILRFGFVLEPPGIVGILPSFWGFLLYFVPFGASLGDTWYISVVWGLHLAHLVYTSFCSVCFLVANTSCRVCFSGLPRMLFSSKYKLPRMLFPVAAYAF